MVISIGKKLISNAVVLLERGRPEVEDDQQE